MRLGGEVASVYILPGLTHSLLHDGDLPSASPSPVGCVLLYDTFQLTGPLPIYSKTPDVLERLYRCCALMRKVFCPRLPMTENAT